MPSVEMVGSMGRKVHFASDTAQCGHGLDRYKASAYREGRTKCLTAVGERRPG